MKIRSVTSAVFLCLLCGQALAQQQPVVVRKTSPGIIHGPSGPIPGSGTLGGKAMLKPGQAYVGGKISAPTNAAMPAPSGSVHH